MKNQNKKNNLRELIINNPRAKNRKELKEVEEQVKNINRNLANKSKTTNSLWQI